MRKCGTLFSYAEKAFIANDLTFITNIVWDSHKTINMCYDSVVKDSWEVVELMLNDKIRDIIEYYKKIKAWRRQNEMLEVQIHEEKEKREIRGAEPDVEFAKLRFLMAEDAIELLELQRDIVEKQGASVELAIDGKQALGMFEKSVIGYYQIILLDYKMPVMDGIKVAQEIRNLKRTDAKEVIIIILSVLKGCEIDDKHKNVNIDAYMTKPLNIRELKEILRKYLPNNQ